MYQGFNNIFNIINDIGLPLLSWVGFCTTAFQLNIQSCQCFTLLQDKHLLSFLWINIDGSLNSKVFCLHIFNILTLHNCKKRKKKKGQLHVSPGDVISSRDEGVTRIDFLRT